MTPDQLQQYKQALTSAKFNPDSRNYDDYAYQRGWNSCLEFAERKWAEITKTPEDKKVG